MKNINYAVSIRNFTVWQFYIYLLMVFLLIIFKFYNYAIVQLIVNCISEIIPSIKNYTILAKNQHKAELEIALAWLIIFATPLIEFKNINTQLISRYVQLNKNIKPFIILFAVSFLFAIALFYKVEISSSIRSQFIHFWFKNDLSFVWGLALILVGGITFSALTGSAILIFKQIMVRIK